MRNGFEIGTKQSRQKKDWISGEKGEDSGKASVLKCADLVARLGQALLYQRIPTSFETADEAFPSLAKLMAILPIHVVRV